MKFYRDLTGTANVAGNVKEILGWLVRYALIFVPAAAAAFALPRRIRNWPWLPPVVFALVGGILAAKWRSIEWLSAARPLPVLIIAIGLASAIEFVKKRQNNRETVPLIVRLTMLVFSFALLGKMILNVRIYHYGFALAMPASLLMITALLCWIPSAINNRGGRGGVFCAAAFAALAVTSFVYLHWQQLIFSGKTYPVSKGADRIMADPSGQFVNLTLDVIASQVKTNETLTVLPEGIMLNYLSRHAVRSRS